MKQYAGGVRHDYKDRLIGSPLSQKRRWSLFAIGLIAPLLGVSLLLVSEAKQPRALPEQPEPNPIAETPEAAPELIVDGPVQVALALPSKDALPTESRGLIENRERAGSHTAGDSRMAAESRVTIANHAATESREAPDFAGSAGIDPAAAVLDLVVNKGDSLERLFRRNKLDLTDLAAMVRLPAAGNHLKRLQPGDRIEIRHDNGAVLSLSREIDATSMLSITRRDQSFEAQTLSRDVQIETTATRGVIESSLFEAGANAGLSDAVIMKLAGMFQWDIDFIQDVRVGDAFTVIYEELWRDGEKLSNGEIVAAEFINQGKVYRAARYTDASGKANYFTPDGRSVRRAFIRAPVDFTRISSNFNPNRRHPVLNTIRAHRGVDYAAPTGTPIRAAGDGKVIFRGSQGGYGNTVIIQHGGNITTLYAHLSKFAGPKAGSRVRQGEIVGYVGKSGLATGPHLHYEYRVDGVHRNPRTVPLPAADPVPPEYQDDFRTKTAALWRQLDLYQGTQLAAVSE